MEPIELSSQSRKRKREPSPEPSESVEHGGTGPGNPACKHSSSLGPEQASSDSQSFYDLPSSSITSTTHDTTASSFHFESIHDFTKELQTALAANWATRKSCGSSKYEAVKALLLSWEEDDLGVGVEVDLLGQLLEGAYGYEVEKWRIPSLNSFMALDKQVRNFAESIWSTSSSLFILYYAGHARPSRDLGSFPRWSS